MWLRGYGLLALTLENLWQDNYMLCTDSFSVRSLPLKQRKDKKSSVLGRRLVRQLTVARLWFW